MEALQNIYIKKCGLSIESCKKRKLSNQDLIKENAMD
jgi:hypothetical protein